MSSVELTQWDITLLGLVILGNSVILYIELLNSSATVCLFGFKISSFESPQMKNTFRLIFENISSIQSLKDSIDPESIQEMLFSS